MNIEEFLLEMDDLKKNLQEAQKGLSFVHSEIHMWRDRFLYNLPKAENIEKAALIWCTFRFMTSEDMMKKSPERHIESLRHGIMNEN